MNRNNSINITGSLSDLQDIIVPESVGFFPPAPLWYLVASVIAFLLIRKGIKLLIIFQKNKYRRDAAKELDILEKIVMGSNVPAERIKAAMALPGLLKQTAISAYGREKVARLSQENWITFLNEKVSMISFSDNTGNVLSCCAYGTPEQIKTVTKDSFENLISLIRQWILRHQKELV